MPTPLPLRARCTLLFLALAAMTSAAFADSPRPGKIKVLFDTDIGSDIDDAVALSYLLARPDCELLGITTVTGQPHLRAEMASALCRLAGRPDIPIYPGADTPLVIAQRQPEVPQHAALGTASHATSFPRGEAIEFLRRTIRTHPGEVTLLAVGPLTNIALLFRTDPEIPGLLKELVLMCGQFGAEPVRWGNKEWNAMLDPEATAIVFRSRPPSLRSYGLDVTLRVSLSQEEAARRFTQDPTLELVLAFARVWFEKQKEIFFHDPLAAVSLFHPEVCTMERGVARVELENPDDRGRTLWTPSPDGPQQVAVSVEPLRFFDRYFAPFHRAAAAP